MKDLQAYKDIPHYKKCGYTIRKTSSILNISKDTVKKHWEFDQEEIEKLFFQNNKSHKLSKHEKLIFNLLTKNPMISAKKMSKLLYSLFKEVYSERTTSRYLRNLRERYGLQKDRGYFDYKKNQRLR